MLDFDVLVQVGPVDPLSTPDQLPVGSFLWGAVLKPREPGKRDVNRPSVIKLHDQLIVGQMNSTGPGPSTDLQSSHATPPKVPLHIPQQLRELSQFREGEILHLSASAPGSARFSLPSPLVEREHGVVLCRRLRRRKFYTVRFF